jgi:hypothetical protein
LKFASFVAKEAETAGKSALELKTPFSEQEMIDTNRDFIFENMPGLKNIHIHNTHDDVQIEGTQNAKDAAQPGKPGIFFY